MSAFGELFQQGASVPTFFKEDTEPSTVVTGRILAVVVRQKTKYNSNPPELEVFPSGDPKMEVVLTLDTDLTDPTLEDDDGARRIYINWWGDKRKGLEAAVRTAGDNDLRVGGTFTARYEGLGEKKPGISAPKLYTYWYDKPSTLGLAPAAPTAPAGPAVAPPVVRAVAPYVAPPAVPTPPAAAVPPPPAAPAAPDLAAVAAQIQQYMAAGWTDDQLAGPFPDVDHTALAAIRSMPAA